MQINTTLSAIGNLLALITDQNPGFALITEAELVVNSVVAQPIDADGNNAVLNVSATGYDDTDSFTFRQLLLSEASVAAPAAVSLVAGAAAADILAAVAAAYGLLESELSLTNEADAVAGAATAVVDVIAGSSLYLAGPINVALTWTPVVVPPVQNPSISTLVTSSVLKGFDVVTPVVVTPPAADGSTPAADGTTTGAATDGTTPAAPAADGAAPAADGSAT